MPTDRAHSVLGQPRVHTGLVESVVAERQGAGSVTGTQLLQSGEETFL